MPALYHKASVMAYVSFYEGFGMPIAEAMAAGTAVVTSNCTSMPEVAGEFAELVDPHDIESIRDGLDKLLSNPQLRLSRSKEGKEWAQQWNWRHSALSLMNSFKQLR
jgi:alpha-1,3-rhamnosyl/mannosyltransferase